MLVQGVATSHSKLATATSSVVSSAIARHVGCRTFQKEVHLSTEDSASCSHIAQLCKVRSQNVEYQLLSSSHDPRKFFWLRKPKRPEAKSADFGDRHSFRLPLSAAAVARTGWQKPKGVLVNDLSTQVPQLNLRCTVILSLHPNALSPKALNPKALKP